jgi:hypothetical protein
MPVAPNHRGRYPVTSFGAALFRSQTNTWSAFQALTSWHQPFTCSSQVTNGTPADGIRFGFEAYGATYYELYVSDIDYAPNSNQLTEWHERLTATAPQMQLARSSAGSGLALTWDRAGPVTTVEVATNVAGSFQAASTVTNAFAWTNAAPISSLSRGFYRARQRE